MSIFIGLDCGGTSTRAVAATASGDVLGVGRGGASNPNAAGADATVVALRDSVAEALRVAGKSLADVTAIFMGMAGIVGADDLALGRSLIHRAGLDAPHVKIGLDHDIRIALAGGLPGEEGLALIVGTGSSCYGRTRAGATWQSGGWGSVLDDGGSAFGLGNAAMRAAVRIADGRLPDSPLLQSVMTGLGLKEIRQIVERVYRTGISKTEVAALAPLVIEAWHAGDPVALDIVKEGCHELAWIVETAARKLGLTAPAVCYSGGLIEKSAEYANAVTAEIQRRAPGARVAPARLPPVLGAVLLAFDSGAQHHAPETWQRLLSTYQSKVSE